MSTEMMQKVAAAAPEKYHFIVKAAAEIKDGPFADEVIYELDRIMEKAAGWEQFAQNNPMTSKAIGAVGAGAAAVGGAAVAGIAYALAGDMYEATKRGLLKSRNYKNMLAQDPELKQMPAKDVQKAFSVLHRFNPEFSSDPIVASAWVKRQATYPEFASDSRVLGDLISARKNITDLKRLPSVPQMPGGKKDKGGFGSKERRSLDDANAGIVDLDSRMGRLEGAGGR